MDEERIKEFFDDAKILFKEHKLDEKKLDNFISGLKFRLDVFQTAKKEMDVYLASDFNVFDYISTDENRLSDIIADLLNPSGKHGQGDIFLREFLKKIEISGSYETQKSKVVREDLTTGIIKSLRRIDITIEFDGKSAIGIENKPWAVEQEDQIEDYKEHLEKKYKGNFVLVYLSGIGNDPQSISKDKMETLKQQEKLKVLSYKNGLNGWLGYCYKECKAEKVRWFLRDFIKYVEREFKQDLSERREEE